MKKVFVMIFVLVLVLTACAKAPVATPESTVAATVEPTTVITVVPTEPAVMPTPEIEVTTLFERVYAQDELKSSLVLSNAANQEKGLYEVILNGKAETVKINDCSKMVVAHGKYPSGAVQFMEYEFSPEFFDQHKGVEYTAILDRFDYETLVLVPNTEMPKSASSDDLNASSWNKTKATVAVWDYPVNPHVVENMTTGEVAFFYIIGTYDDNSRQSFLYEGDSAWGWISIEDASGFQTMNITESQPDYTKLEQAMVLANESFPEQNFSGPSSACYTLNYSYNGGKLDKALVNDLCQMYYTKK